MVQPQMQVGEITTRCSTALGLPDETARWACGLFVVDEPADSTVGTSADGTATPSVSEGTLPSSPWPLRTDDHLGTVVVSRTKQRRAFRLVYMLKARLPDAEASLSTDAVFAHLTALHTDEEARTGVPQEMQGAAHFQVRELRVAQNAPAAALALQTCTTAALAIAADGLHFLDTRGEPLAGWNLTEMCVLSFPFLSVLRWGGSMQQFTVEVASTEEPHKKLRDRKTFQISMSTESAKAIAASLLNYIEAIMAQPDWTMPGIEDVSLSA